LNIATIAFVFSTCRRPLRNARGNESLSAKSCEKEEEARNDGRRNSEGGEEDEHEDEEEEEEE